MAGRLHRHLIIILPLHGNSIQGDTDEGYSIIIIRRYFQRPSSFPHVTKTPFWQSSATQAKVHRDIVTNNLPLNDKAHAGDIRVHWSRQVK